MRRKQVLLSLCASLMLCVASANGAFYTTTVAMDGLQVTPPVATPGTGSALVTFDSATGQMTVNGSFQDLIGTANNAHVHGYAGPGTPAPVVFGLTFTFSTSGAVTGNGVIPAGNINDVLNGLTFIDIHSTFRPGGEIRGQITNLQAAVPEPMSVAVWTFVLAGLVAARRLLCVV